MVITMAIFLAVAVSVRFKNTPEQAYIGMGHRKVINESQVCKTSQ